MSDHSGRSAEMIRVSVKAIRLHAGSHTHLVRLVVQELAFRLDPGPVPWPDA